MKKFLLSIFFIASSTLINAQMVVNDSVILGAGYMNQSFYSLSDGEQANIDNTNWDIALDASGYGATIRINSAIGTELYKYPNGDTSSWSNLDTSGINSWSPVYDSDTSWGLGAFNRGMTSSSMDMGWGVYSIITHHITGDSLFVIKLSNGVFKKLQITSLISGVYNLKHANLDGSNEIISSVDKSNYANKNFGYYNLRTDSALDREPTDTLWDLLFTKYITKLSPSMYYGVTGVMHNAGVKVAEMSGVSDVNSATNYMGQNYETAINTIGYDWKSFNMGTFSYEISDSLCYFIEDKSGQFWRLVLTGFDGSSTGKIIFNKSNISNSQSIGEEKLTFGLYPNPAEDVAHIVFNNSDITYITIQNLFGQVVMVKQVEKLGLIDYPVNLSQYKKGLYIIKIQQGNKIGTERLIIK